MDRQQMERCLERVAAYRASGQTAQAWADANDVPMRAIGFCRQNRRQVTSAGLLRQNLMAG